MNQSKKQESQHKLVTPYLDRVAAPSAHNLPIWKNVVAGASAGLVEVLIMYPLDVVKTRMQLQKGQGKYNTILNTLSTIVKEEGPGNLYRGIIAPITAEAPKRAVKFAGNELFKPFFQNKQGKISNLGAAGAGALAGATEAFINTPFEVVKVRMISPDALGLYKSTGDAVGKIIKQEGPLALYKGFEAQMTRNAIWNGTYFGVINFTKQILWTPKDKASEIWRNFTAGFIAGTLATTLNTPFDVVKSRLQNARSGERPWSFTGVANVYKEEGFRALYKGFAPRVLRLGPGGGIMLLAFDFVAGLLKDY